MAGIRSVLHSRTTPITPSTRCTARGRITRSAPTAATLDPAMAQADSTDKEEARAPAAGRGAGGAGRREGAGLTSGT